MSSERWLRQYIHTRLTRALSGTVKVAFGEEGRRLVAELAQAALDGWPIYAASEEVDVGRIRSIFEKAAGK